MSIERVGWWCRGVVLCLLVGCSGGPAELGPAVLGVYLGNETDLSDWVHLRAGMGVAVAMEVSTAGVASDGLLRGARVQVSTRDDQPVQGEAWAPGVYRTPFDDALWLPPDDEPVRFSVAHDGRTLTLASAIPPILPLAAGSLVVAPGEPLVVDLPSGWEQSYDHVVVQVFDGSGALRYDTLPVGFGAWIQTLSSSERPGQVRVPSEVFEGSGERALAVYFVRQMDQQVVFGGPINEPVSGLWAGTAWLVPVEVAL